MRIPSGDDDRRAQRHGADADRREELQYPDARRAIDAGVSVAIATNCNPCSSYTTSMAFCIALAVRDMHMTVDEALAAATLGGARALRRSDIGHLAVGARADAVCSTRRPPRTSSTGRACRSWR